LQVGYREAHSVAPTLRWTGWHPYRPLFAQFYLLSSALLPVRMTGGAIRSPNSIRLRTSATDACGGAWTKEDGEPMEAKAQSLRLCVLPSALPACKPMQSAPECQAPLRPALRTGHALNSTGPAFIRLTHDVLHGKQQPWRDKRGGFLLFTAWGRHLNEEFRHLSSSSP
jgi:hypothetical protein